MKFVMTLTENGAILHEDLERAGDYIVYKNHIDWLKAETAARSVNLETGLTITKILDDEYTEPGPCLD